MTLRNIQGRLRSGYELVRADEYPDSDYPVVEDGKYKGVIGVGGLVLARVPEEIAKSRKSIMQKCMMTKLKRLIRSHEGTAPKYAYQY